MISNKRYSYTLPTSDWTRSQPRQVRGWTEERENVTKIGHHDSPRDHLEEDRSATRPLLKSTISISQPIPQQKPTFDHLLSYPLSDCSSMPLVRSQGDEFRHIEPNIGTTSIERWRVSTYRSQRSPDLCSSSNPASWKPRSSSKTASRMTAAYGVVRLEQVQEDEEGDGHPALQPELLQTTMEATVSGPSYVYPLGFTMYVQDQMDEVTTSAYTCPAGPPADGGDQAHPMILSSPTHDLTNPFPFTFEDSGVSYVSICLYRP